MYAITNLSIISSNATQHSLELEKRKEKNNKNSSISAKWGKATLKGIKVASRKLHFEDLIACFLPAKGHYPWSVVRTWQARFIAFLARLYSKIIFMLLKCWHSCRLFQLTSYFLTYLLRDSFSFFYLFIFLYASFKDLFLFLQLVSWGFFGAMLFFFTRSFLDIVPAPPSPLYFILCFLIF